MGVDADVDEETKPWTPVKPVEYSANLLGADRLRKDLKPLQVVQPEGPSFTINQRAVSWQEWTFQLGWSLREGPILHDVRYDGRPLFYRVSMSEMTVPYGDPRSPYHRKQAFDLGDSGFGLTSNSLSLGCDCLGLIAYFDGIRTAADGTPLVMPNVVCMHEQDDGIGWKHTNFRNGMSSVVRDPSWSYSTQPPWPTTSTSWPLCSTRPPTCTSRCAPRASCPPCPSGRT